MKDKLLLDMFSIRSGWGITGQQPGREYLHFTTYSENGQYMGSVAMKQDGLRLTDLRWEKKQEYNIGSDLAFFENGKLSMSFNYYNNLTTDQLMGNYAIPSANGYSSLSYRNSGSIRNKGWELNLNGNKFIKVGKFSVDTYFNVGQNFNTVVDMEESVLNSANGEFSFSNGTYMGRIQLDNPLGSIYGFRTKKDVYRYSYKNYDKAVQVAQAEGLNVQDICPVAVDKDGEIIMGANNKPLPMVFNYGTTDYYFKGGDIVYEDINHDGNINELDIVYLGNSNPKAQGGFGVTLNYDRWSLRANFNYRYGVDAINFARMNVENMYGNNNQSIAVNWRWRKEGDVTQIPRALYQYGFNFMGSDRYVEDASFLRLSYLQLSYSVDPQKLKKYGLNSLRFNGSMNNLFVLTKYTGLDPEVGYGGWGRAEDHAKTPRGRSYTLAMTVGF